MNISNQKRLAAKVAHAGTERIILVPERVGEIKDAITKADIRTLIKSGAIRILPTRSPSRIRAKIRNAQKKRGRQRGPGARKGGQSARMPHKLVWIRKIRLMRATLKHLKSTNMVTPQVYNDIYRKAKGNFFRDKGHMLFYLKQNKLMK
ncbi:MAG: 50S ribosomal protein L19e [DPANN group archaeon]|nr:50S ribosomal protein L19e [DPANN group archaeon]